MDIPQRIFNFRKKFFPVADIVASRSYIIVFKTTHYCWYNCAHCCENSGPHQPRRYIPLPAIRAIVDGAVADPAFARNIVFTGGEIMTAYRFAAPGYVKDALNYALDTGCGVDVKTNAAWTRAAFGRQIFDDLAELGGAHPGYNLQISLSLDTFHKNAIENNVRLISELARRKANVVVHISGLGGKWYVAPDVVYDKLKKSGFNVRDAFVTGKSGSGVNPVKVANDSVILLAGAGTLFAGGRAENIGGAEPQMAPQFQIMNSDYNVLYAYDASGRVTLGEAGRRKIGTNWARSDGAVRPMLDVRRDLVKNALWEELRYRVIAR